MQGNSVQLNGLFLHDTWTAAAHATLHRPVLRTLAVHLCVHLHSWACLDESHDLFVAFTDMLK